MQVEWTTYSSPVGGLTVVECEAGPLVVEFPHRATSVKWAVRLRSAIPELHIAQGPCRLTTAWLDDYFSGAARPFPFPDHLKQWFDLGRSSWADYDKGLIDFPSLHDGREVYLCWRLGEPQVAYWHELDAGFAGRQKLSAEEVHSN